MSELLPAEMTLDLEEVWMSLATVALHNRAQARTALERTADSLAKHTVNDWLKIICEVPSHITPDSRFRQYYESTAASFTLGANFALMGIRRVTQTPIDDHLDLENILLQSSTIAETILSGDNGAPKNIWLPSFVSLCKVAMSDQPTHKKLRENWARLGTGNRYEMLNFEYGYSFMLFAAQQVVRSEADQHFEEIMFKLMDAGDREKLRAEGLL